MPLLRYAGHCEQFFGKYGCVSLNVWPSLPGLFSSPFCGGVSSMLSNTLGLAGSSVKVFAQCQYATTD